MNQQTLEQKRQCDMIALAAARGDFNLVKTLYENGSAWNQEVCEFAAQNGHLDILIYAHENGCPFKFDLCVYKNIITGDHIDTFKYITEHGIHYPLPSWYDNTCFHKNGGANRCMLYYRLQKLQK